MKLNRAEKEGGEEASEHRSPEPDAGGEEHTADPIDAPERESAGWEHRQTHQKQHLWTFAEGDKERRVEQVEEGHMIIKDITVLQQTVRPAPHNM